MVAPAKRIPSDLEIAMTFRDLRRIAAYVWGVRKNLQWQARAVLLEVDTAIINARGELLDRAGD